MARDHRDLVERALRAEEGGQRAHARRRRPRDPPGQRPRRRLLPGADARRARAVAARAQARARASRSRPWPGPRRCRFPDFEEDYDFVALRDARRVRDRGRAAASRARGLDIAPAEFDEHFVEEHVAHSTALHSRLRDGTRYLVGPLARYALNRRPAVAGRARGRRRGRPRASRAATRSAASSCARSRSLYALDEALRLIDAYEPPDPPGRRGRRRARASGYGWTEAPRGLLCHRYEIDDDGTILDARIVPPTSQNQGRDRADLRGFVAAPRRPARRRAARCAASRRSATTTRASPARRTSCAWRSTAGDGDRRRQRVAGRRRPASRWRAACAKSAAARRVEHEGDATALVDAWSGAAHVVFVDAARRARRRARCTASMPLAARCRCASICASSTHAFGVADAVELGCARPTAGPAGRLRDAGADSSPATA